MRKEYDLLILGATALAAGIAAAHPELKIAVLESTSSVAAEFSDAIQTDNAALYRPVTAQAAGLERFFRSRKALDEHGEWLPAVQPILTHVLKTAAPTCTFSPR